jgi:hypothetical protein
MWRVVFLVMMVACSKEKASDKSADEGSGSVAAPAPDEKTTTDVTAADVMKAKIEEAKAKAAAETPPTPPAPPPPPPPDPMPTETPPPVDATDATPMPPEESPATPAFKVGDRVMAKWDNAKWYPGRIVGIKDGKYDVDFDDGDKSRGLAPTRVRKPDGAGSGR